jgi:non-canonical purine NTP pyrophosphatase (RdgB/HAM1 family)
MNRVVFVTGNAHKAKYLSELLGIDIAHEHIELEEIQSMSLTEITQYKARQAFGVIGRPVLVEDIGLFFTALDGLPGPFVKYFVNSHDGLENMCRMLDGFTDRRAVARSVFALYDGHELTLLEGALEGTIAEHPRGEGGFGWDAIFCPEGYDGKTRAELAKQQDIETYKTIKPIDELRKLMERYDGN